VCQRPATQKIVIDETVTEYIHGDFDWSCQAYTSIKCPVCGEPSKKKIVVSETQVAYLHRGGKNCLVNTEKKKMKRYSESDLQRICEPTKAQKKILEAKRIEVSTYVRLHMGELQSLSDWEEVGHPFLKMKPFRACWCLHCERVYPAKLWRDLDFDCPGEDCNGGALDITPFRDDFHFGEYLPMYPKNGERGLFSEDAKKKP
jgi:hypothetical protein